MTANTIPGKVRFKLRTKPECTDYVPEDYCVTGWRFIDSKMYFTVESEIWSTAHDCFDYEFMHRYFEDMTTEFLDELYYMLVSDETTDADIIMLKLKYNV